MRQRRADGESATVSKPVHGLRAAAALLALVTACAAYAAEDEEAELLAVLKQETDLATKTRMNSDFVPGIVTILEGDRLRALGARTVWDAMAYVPGVLPILDGTGTPEVAVRGVPFPFNSGSIQILLNSVPIARASAGLNTSVLFVPLKQVERIEFIRGPGSVLYGDFAFQGLINIVTRKQGREVSGEVDSHGGRGGDLLLGGEHAGWNTSINLAAQTTDDAILPETASGQENRFSGVVGVKYGDFSLQSQAVDRHVYDVAFAPHTAPPRRGETNWSTDARYATQLSEVLGFDAHAQYLYNDIDTITNAFKGSEVNSGIDLHWTGWTHQNWLAGVEYSDGSIDSASALLQPPPGSTQPPAQLTIHDRHRSVASVFAQDQIELTPSLSTTLGARYDDNSEIGERVTPRVALVWQAAEHHVLKLQYSEGYRAPTFFELYGGVGTRADLDFEVNRTAEFNYVYERPQLTARATLFHMRISDMVFINPAAQAFGNVANAKAQGAEFELTQQVGANLHIDANVSYVDARDNRDLPLLAQQPIMEVPHWMGNIGLLWNPTHDLTLGVHWNHVGDRLGAQPSSGQYDLVDVSLTRRAFLVSSLDVELSVNNAFDQRVIELQSGPFGDQANVYRERVTWGRVTWHW